MCLQINFFTHVKQRKEMKKMMWDEKYYLLEKQQKKEKQKLENRNKKNCESCCPANSFQSCSIKILHDLHKKPFSHFWKNSFFSFLNLDLLLLVLSIFLHNQLFWPFFCIFTCKNEVKFLGTTKYLCICMNSFTFSNYFGYV